MPIWSERGIVSKRYHLNGLDLMTEIKVFESAKIELISESEFYQVSHFTENILRLRIFSVKCET